MQSPLGACCGDGKLLHKVNCWQVTLFQSCFQHAKSRQGWGSSHRHLTPWPTCAVMTEMPPGHRGEPQSGLGAGLAAHTGHGPHFSLPAPQRQEPSWLLTGSLRDLPVSAPHL